MKSKFLAIFSIASISFAVAQEDNSPLIISGSVDTYFKYDFANQPGNINTSFANEHNSISLGMIDLGISKTTGKTSFFGELSFGPRGQSQSLLDEASNGSSFNIQNLYVNYDFTEKFSMTAGFMSTFIGSEVISPAANFHYSTSYLFSSGPFQNAGVKGTYKFSDKVSLMAGLFNDWNVYTATRGVSSIGGQLGLTPTEGFSAYINVLSGAGLGGYGTIEDLTASYEFNDKFKLGLNVANYDINDSDTPGSYVGAALYPQYSITPVISFGLRGEYLEYKKTDSEPKSAYTSVTFTSNIKVGGLTVVPEFRLDNNEDRLFVNKDNSPAPNAGQFTLAAIYAF